MDRLQRLQNRAARLLSRSKATLHITPVRKDLHWLPIQERINYKIIVTVYKCINRLAPNYLSSTLTTRTRDNRLRQKQGGGPGAVVKATCLKSRRSRVRTPLWPPSFKETKKCLPRSLVKKSILWGASVTER